MRFGGGGGELNSAGEFDTDLQVINYEYGCLPALFGAPHHGLLGRRECLRRVHAHALAEWAHGDRVKGFG